MSYDNEKRFVLFINDKKGNDKAPDMKGNIEIEGVKYYLSAWSGLTKDGKKYLSGSAELPQENNTDVANNAPVEQAPPPDENDLPF